MCVGGGVCHACDKYGSIYIDDDIDINLCYLEYFLLDCVQTTWIILIFLYFEKSSICRYIRLSFLFILFNENFNKCFHNFAQVIILSEHDIYFSLFVKAVLFFTVYTKCTTETLILSFITVTDFVFFVCFLFVWFFVCFLLFSTVCFYAMDGNKILVLLYSHYRFETDSAPFKRLRKIHSFVYCFKNFCQKNFENYQTYKLTILYCQIILKLQKIIWKSSQNELYFCYVYMGRHILLQGAKITVAINFMRKSMVQLFQTIPNLCRISMEKGRYLRKGS